MKHSQTHNKFIVGNSKLVISYYQTLAESNNGNVSSQFFLYIDHKLVEKLTEALLFASL